MASRLGHARWCRDSPGHALRHHRGRSLCLAVLVLAVAVALAVGASGCGGVGVSGAAANVSDQLTIYSSLPLQGPSAEVSKQIVGGEKLALADAGGRIGQFRVGYYSLDDSNLTTGQWDPGVTAADAKTAAQDTNTIAYLGDYDSGASAVSLPLMNGAGILQVSPASPYVGLTSSEDAGQDEPERFYPTGRRNFGRLMPADPIQAGAQAALMGELKVKKLYVLNDQDPFQIPLAEIVAGDAEKAGIQVEGDDGVSTTSGTEFAGEVHKVVQSGAQAVFFSGNLTPGVEALWLQLHAADPDLLLLGSSSLANSAFAAKIAAAAESTYLTTPILPAGMYPLSAQRVFANYRRIFDETATPYALYGYEAMSVVLQAIRDAGSHGNDRQAVIDQFFRMHDRDSVLGRYSIQPSGDSTLSQYGVERVVGGRLAFWRAFDVG
jgi:branched-chain amino acid transport system substrate-binding protein